jgi:MarR family transcriptional regulator, temperature-dependent positive regulator of motility
MSKPDLEAALPQLAEASQGSNQPVDFDLNLSPSHLLHRAQQVAADLHSAAFGARGLTLRQLAVLIVLGAGDGISQTQLVGKTGIDRSTLAEMVARMEAKGLMVRVKSVNDSRANAVSLTQMGRDSLGAALPKLAAIDQAVLGLVSSSRRDTLIELLARMALASPKKFEAKAGEEVKKAKKKDKKKKDKKKKADKA